MPETAPPTRPRPRPRPPATHYLPVVTHRAAGSYLCLAVTLLSLPTGKAEQTHEIYFCKETKTAFVTVVTSSRLMQLSFDAHGRVTDNVREWTVGHPEHNPRPEEAGLHNVVGSTRFPGMLWIATETDDRVYLVDPSDGFRVRAASHRTHAPQPRTTHA